jgi:hypothetical protein
MVGARQPGHSVRVRTNKRHVALPIGRTARFAFEIDSLRSDCSTAAGLLCSQKRLNEQELEECAKLDDALAEAQCILKTAVRGIMLSRIDRRSRRSPAR